MKFEGLTPLLEVYDMDRSLAFYCGILGFSVVSRSPGNGWCLLQNGDASLMLNTAYDDEDERPERPEPDVSGGIATSRYM